MAGQENSKPWRQGDILFKDQLERLGLQAVEGKAIAIIATHDCDLARTADKEPEVEIILGQAIDNVEGNYTYCKSTRCLHTGLTGGVQQINVELDATRKKTVSKLTLLEETPSEVTFMTPDECNTLQIWLATRYRRTAFSDEFNERLTKTKIADKLPPLLKGSGYSIPAIFFDVDNGEDVNREGADNPFELVITLLYSTGVDPEASLKIAQRAKSDIEQLFDKRCTTTNENGVKVWQWIELVDVEVVADTALTYAQSQMLKKWQADYVSLRADPPQQVLAI